MPGGEFGRGDDTVIAAARAATFVLLGEATHGTSEFYSERAKVTMRLLDDHRASAVVIEADGTEVEQVNLFVRGIGLDRSAAEALSSFRRFPRWMWRNAEFAGFVEALRTANLRLPEAERVGLYGMDVYDLYGALERVRAYVRLHVPGAAAAANAAIRCFAPHRRSTEAYGVASRKAARSCAAPAQALLDALRHAPTVDLVTAGEERFAAFQAAEALVDGEAYLHASFAGAYSWNVRERSMAASIKRVAAHAAGQSGTARVIVWTHNSHVARAASTTMVDRGETSIADLLRGDGGDQVFAMGLLTHSGTFMAAPAWDRPGQIYRLDPAARNSVEGLLRRSGEERAVLMLRGAAHGGHSDKRPQRGVGAVYDARMPEAVYSRVQLATEFDAVTFLDKTTAVTPLP
ncbi:erythromycin esterase [Sphingomonas mucosissima]|uniref:Erythromycin esterase n=1 Tax=Sphingomonas mucosissima TaxID=370959 RepID=A0A245ZDX9_9SPHN|nr:erythromycin esterase [Sphingomonas mucosissima]